VLNQTRLEVPCAGQRGKEWPKSSTGVANAMLTHVDRGALEILVLQESRPRTGMVVLVDHEAVLFHVDPPTQSLVTHNAYTYNRYICNHTTYNIYFIYLYIYDTIFRYISN